MNHAWEQMLHTWSNGGWVMAALASVAAIMYATAAHLLFYLRHRRLNRTPDHALQSWIDRPDHAPASIRDLISYTQEDARSLKEIHGRFREVEAAKIPEVDRRLAFLNVLVVASPLFGLLGTVLGMLLTFRAIGVGGSSTSDIIAKGISEALVATQTGMMVAIPGLIAAFVVKRWRTEYVSFLTRLESMTLRRFRRVFARVPEPAEPVAIQESQAAPLVSMAEPLPA